MNSTRLRQLATVLNAMAIKPLLTSPSARRMIQAQVYLAQELGLDAGYGFEWTTQGPYSSELTSDLYDLTVGPTGILPFKLNESYLRRVSRIVNIMKPPVDVKLSNDQWITLLAALHYQNHYARQTKDETRARLRNIDKQLEQFEPLATKVLEAA